MRFRAVLPSSLVSETASRNLSPGFFPTLVADDRQEGILLDGGRGLVLHSCFRLGPRLDLVAGEREVDDHADGAEGGRDAEDHVPLLDRALSKKVRVDRGNQSRKVIFFFR